MVESFDPGPGWREVPAGEWTGDRRRIVEYGPDGETRRKWVREVPLPPLPTEPYTIIRVARKRSQEAALFDQLWFTTTGNSWVSMPEKYTIERPGPSVIWHEQLRKRITGFEVLAEPRAVTARAVLDRLAQKMGWDHDAPAVQVVAREFGVET